MAQATMALLSAPAFTPTSLTCISKSSFSGVSLPLLRSPVVRRSAGSPAVVALFKKETAKKIVNSVSSQRNDDGLFGTSGGIGFTKQNELFVGRMAMLGFGASLLGEAITGKGSLAQFDLETGLPLNETEPLLIFFILFTLLGAIGALGSRGKFVNNDEPVGLPVIPGKSVKGALGLNEKGPTFGFTKANELFVGRMAQLGFAISVLGEAITGKGTLAQLNIETGLPINEIEPLVGAIIVFFFAAAFNPGNGKFISDEETD